MSGTPQQNATVALSVAQIETCAAITGMARDMGEFTDQIIAGPDNVALTPLARAARSFWARAQVTLALADVRYRLKHGEIGPDLTAGLPKTSAAILARNERRVLHTSLNRRLGMAPSPCPELKESRQ